MFRALTESLSKGPWPVAGSVIGHHFGDLDTDVREEIVRAPPEPGSSALALTIENFGVGEPRIAIDSR